MKQPLCGVATLGGEGCLQCSLPEPGGWLQGPLLEKANSDLVPLALFAIPTGHVWGCVSIG